MIDCAKPLTFQRPAQVHGQHHGERNPAKGQAGGELVAAQLPFQAQD